jgi:hypothetical protein
VSELNMKLTCDNATFAGSDREMARIMKEAGKALRYPSIYPHAHGRMLDTSGNDVGHWEFRCR